MKVQIVKAYAYKPILKGIPRPLAKEVKKEVRLSDTKYLQFYNRLLY